MSKNHKSYEDLEEAPPIQTYQAKPVQNYGLDLLKKMGFTSERGIGFNKQNALNQPLVLKPRPKGLGLGAKPEGAIEQKPEFNKKDYIVIKTQPHEGMIGIVKKIKKQEDMLTIQLGISGTQVKVKLNEVQKISESEFKQKQQALKKEHKQRNQQNNEKKKRRLKWILPHIRCKVIDKLSPYYLKKVVITQLLSEREFECIYVSENGEKKYLKQMTEKQLQTILPKIEGVVVVLDKKYRGEKGKLLERNKEKEEVIVQLLESLQIQKFIEDNVAEHVEF